MQTVFIVVLILLAVPPGTLLFYPVGLRLLNRWWTAPDSKRNTTRTKPDSYQREAPASRSTASVGLVTVCNRLDAKLETKLAELAELAQLDSVTERHVGLDGVAPPDSVSASPVIWTSVDEPQGKNALLKRIHGQAQADILVFTDVDASVSLDSLERLLGAFDDPEVGAVTGRRVILDETRFGEAQAAYTGLDNRIRKLEMGCLGSVTSCDGKLYAIRRALITGLPTDVTDDLYTGLGAIAAGYRLHFEPEAVAFIGRPARDWRHELLRRRRVTCRGLSTLWHRRTVLDPRLQGLYAPALFINKGLRRLAAPCLLMGVVLLLALGTAMVNALGSGYLLAYGMGLSVLIAALAIALRSKLGAVLYLLLGTLGMSLGVLDYLLGRRVSMWTPTKASDGRHESS